MKWDWRSFCKSWMAIQREEIAMEYHLQYRKDRQWIDWGYKTTNLFEIKQKIEHARKAVGGRVKLRYIARQRKNSYQNSNVLAF